MIVRKLACAAKQLLLNSSCTPTGLFHAANISQQASKCSLLSPSYKKVSPKNSSVAGVLPATHKTPPRALLEAPEEPKLHKPADCVNDRPRRRSWHSRQRLLRQEACEVEEEEKKKKKKRGPPGPVEFENLTSTSPVHSDLPFAFRYSYTEIPKVPAVGFQEKFSPFGPGRLDRVWDGQQAIAIPASSSCAPKSPATLSSSSVLSEKSVLNMKNSKYSFKGVRLINPPSPSPSYTRKVRTREEVLGKPLTPQETKQLVASASKHKTKRQINMGRDGLTHNMLIDIQDHWKREPVVRIRCKGVCTLDMNNVCFQLEDKSGGKIIERVGGTIYLFRGRNFRYRDRPIIPPMLWKPHAPLYPKLIGAPPGGLKFHEAIVLRKRGLKIMRLCILSKNAYYGDLVQHVKEAFEDDELVRIDCKCLNRSDYKKIGAKLRDLVPCYLLSFDKEQIILWRGREWISTKMDSSNFTQAKGADVRHVEEGGNIPTLNVRRCENVNEDFKRCQFVANWSENSDKEANLSNSSDSDAESLDHSEKSRGIGRSDEDVEASVVSEVTMEAWCEDHSADDRILATNSGNQNGCSGDENYSSDFATSEEDDAWRA